MQPCKVKVNKHARLIYYPWHLQSCFHWENEFEEKKIAFRGASPRPTEVKLMSLQVCGALCRNETPQRLAMPTREGCLRRY